MTWFTKSQLQLTQVTTQLGFFYRFIEDIDTLNHKILLYKLNHYGICGIALDWLASYVSNCYEYVEYSGVRSNYLKITRGVPQVSLLLRLYINDIVIVPNILRLILFADDRNFFVEEKS